MVLITCCSFNAPAPVLLFYGPKQEATRGHRHALSPIMSVEPWRHKPLHTGPFIYRWAKWQLRPLCVSAACVYAWVFECMCALNDILSFSFSNRWRNPKAEHETRNQAQKQSVFFHYCKHTHTHTEDEAFWHFKNGSDGKWDCVKQSGKRHTGDCSLLLIKHAIKRERETERMSVKERRRKCSCLSFLCKPTRGIISQMLCPCR